MIDIVNIVNSNKFKKIIKQIPTKNLKTYTNAYTKNALNLAVKFAPILLEYITYNIFHILLINKSLK